MSDASNVVLEVLCRRAAVRVRDAIARGNPPRGTEGRLRAIAEELEFIAGAFAKRNPDRCSSPGTWPKQLSIGLAEAATPDPYDPEGARLIEESGGE